MTYEVINGARLGSPARTADPERAPLRIGVVQADWEPDTRRLRDKLADGVRLAAAHGAQLVCTQELTLGPRRARPRRRAHDKVELETAGPLMELDHSLLPNLKHLKPAFAGTGRLAPDPRYGVAKDYGIASFFWRADVVDTPPRTIAEGFEMLDRHRDATVNVIESSNELIALALAALGLSINSEDDDDLARARDLLIAAKPAFDTISTQYIERGQRGEIDIGIGYSGDVRRIKQARAEAGDAIEFLIPDGPTEAFVDVWAIPANAPHPVAAHAWINYVLDPRNAARETEHIQFGSPVAGSERHLPAELADDPITSIPDEALARFEIPSVLSPEGERKRSRIFTEFKAA